MSKETNSKVRTEETQVDTFETNILKLAIGFSDQSLAEVNTLLSQWGLTALQYSALRILYLQDPAKQGISSKDIGSRLYTRVPDVTRLLDRMVAKGWITRERDTTNKRVVLTRLTEAGESLIKEAYEPVMELETEQLQQLSYSEKKTLFQLIQKAMTRPSK